MVYKLYTVPEGEEESILYGFGDMPIPCGSLVDSWCPFIENKIYTYAVSFELVNNSTVYSYIGQKMKTNFTIEMYGENELTTIKEPLFRISTLITFQFCKHHVFC